jgi:ABC-type uncharacterized transport system involved in gliding motility auxiliary subunit
MSGVPALLGALGLVGLAFGFASFVLWLLRMPTDWFWIFVNLGAGVVLLASAGLMSADALRERLRSGEARRAGRYGSSAMLSAALAVAIVAGLGFLATRYHKRFDWTEQKVHSLSDQSLKLVQGLDRDVEVQAFFSPVAAGPVRELLDRYAYASPRFKLEFVDPEARPDLVERHGIAASELGEGLVRIALGGESVNVDKVSEENVTNAIVKLSRQSQKVVYFTVGHNERAIESEAGEARDGYARAATALRNENYRVETLLLAAKGEVPEDAQAVVVAGATRPLLPEEHAALERYLARGGALFALVDPRARTDLLADLARWGVEVGDDVIVDRSLALFGRATTPFAGDYARGHQITRDLRETTLFHLARSVRPAAGADGDFESLVFTGEASWAERDLSLFFEGGRAELGPDDLRGPVSLAVAGRPRLAAAPGGGAADVAAPAPGSGGGEPGEAADASAAQAGAEDAGAAAAKKGPRLVVFGDADFAGNEYIEAYRNRDLFVNSVNWLLGDVEAIAIRPNRARASRFQLTQAQFQQIRSLSLFVLPELIAVGGVLVWWRRRAPAQ